MGRLHGSAARESLSWPARIQADLAVVRQASADSFDNDRSLADVAPRIVDSVHRDELASALEAVDASVKASHAGLAYAEARIAEGRGDDAASFRWLLLAQSSVCERDRPLAAPIAFELAYRHLARSQRAAADTVLAWGEAMMGPLAADDPYLTHIAALIAEQDGRYGDAAKAYRKVMTSAGRAITPLLSVLALMNLAVATHHRRPSESASLARLALATLEAQSLNSRVRPAIRNILGYALLCSADLGGAREMLELAHSEAERAGGRRISLFARFNLAIADELEGNASAAAARLELLEGDARQSEEHELLEWIRIRQAWLDIKARRVESARRRLEPFSQRLPERLANTVGVLAALASLADGRLHTARVDLARLTGAFRASGDDLTAFTLHLWLVVLEDRAGRLPAARRNLHQAVALGRAAGFRVSPNWWSEDLVRCATVLAAGDDELRPFAAVLHAARVSRRLPGTSAEVRITPDGSVRVDGRHVDETMWRAGRTGSRILKRYFGILIAAFPRKLRRDEICEELWPDSDGDRAIQNFYSATNDLRRVLGDLPGVTLQSEEGMLRLRLASNVEIVPRRT